MCHVGVVAKSLLKVRLRCKFRDAEERAAFRSTHSAKSIAHSQMHRRKSCVVGCEVVCGGGPESLLKVRLMCKARHALRGQAAPQNQLQLAECTC